MSAALRVSEPPGSCIVGTCKRDGTVRMRIGPTLGSDAAEADFCEKCAPMFEGVWTRVGEPEQLTLDG